MNAYDRRKKIINKLLESQNPVSASCFAKDFSVSRQVIVGDIAILRASGEKIESTARGYVLDNNEGFGYIGIIAAQHEADDIEDELNTIVDFGGTCIDISIEHELYGEITGRINISSRYEVREFFERTKKTKPLSALSNGVHIHRIGTPNKKIFKLIEETLTEKGYTYTE